MLVLNNIITCYGSVIALNNISLNVKKGEIVTIIGANGAGKTTILKTISGLLNCTNGKIVFLDEDITKIPPYARVSRGIVHVPEGRMIFKPFTVRENLEIGMYNHSKSMNKKKTKKLMEYVFEVFPRLYERINQRASTLSGGEQQMLAIGRALMGKPKLLLLDEPSLGLAPILVNMIFSKLEKLNEEGLTILVVEQNIKKALKFACRGYLLNLGKIILEGATDDLATKKEIKDAYLGSDKN